ncbi:EF-hand domain-containing protein [Cinnamomum micranthum f. kanehirae]|uniref:EF-hand domain-containing protein n=1 Tax=Cinnamomum micranthum f. kanehirae TaxID=337451 RepID=A0A3S3NHU9_9MAGN|nr:EF-hand domain-containing protein [Cinnamomum micranthum f. kanehirae]
MVLLPAIHMPTHPRMTVKQFKEWFESMDKNRDGNISKEELQEALSGIGMRFVGWKVWRGMVHADLNRNGVIDPAEMDDLIAYAKKRWGIIIQGA